MASSRSGRRPRRPALKAFHGLELADQPLQPGRLLADRRGGSPDLVADGRPVGQGLGEPADDRQRRAQVVAQVGQQARLLGPRVARARPPSR